MKLHAPINAIVRHLIERKRKLENNGLNSYQIEQDDIIKQYRKAIEILEYESSDDKLLSKSE